MSQGVLAAQGHRIAGPAAVAGLALLGAGTLLVADPNEPGHYPTCPFLAVTGLQCPGCGTLRAVHALLHGDVVAAVDLNVVTVLVVPVLFWAWATWLVTGWRGAPRLPTPPAAAGYTAAATFVAFWILRNVPGLGSLAA